MATKTARNVVFSQRAVATIEQETLRSPGIETGGILIGSAAAAGHTNDIHIHFATRRSPATVASSTSLRTDNSYQNAWLSRLQERLDLDYLGDWHKHPAGMPYPSGGDLLQARRILDSPNYGTHELLLPIVTLESRVTIHPYVLERGAESFQATPMEIHLPDWHGFKRDYPWFMAASGNLRLDVEERMLSKAGFSVERRCYRRDGSLQVSLICSSPRSPEKLVCDFPTDYPRQSPTITAVNGEDFARRVFSWDPASLLADVLSPPEGAC